MNGDDDRLTPELQSLLAAEKEAPGPDGGVRDRVARRLAQTLGVTLAAAGASAAATSGAQTVLPKALLGKSLAAKLLVAAVVGGVGVGGVVTTVKLVRRHAAATHATPSTAPAPSPASPPNAPVAPPAVAPAPSLSAVDEPSPLPSAPSPSPSSPSSSRSPSSLRSSSSSSSSHVARHGDLAAERALLTDARSAMQSSDPARALAILDDHAHRFARGQLAEERDALRVAALSLAGDRAAARRHADEFARRHPDSLFLPSVERAVTDSPRPSQ